MTRGPSLALRAVLALVMMALYVALAVGAVVALVWTGVAVLGWLEHIQGRGMIMIGLLGLGCFAAAAVIVWSMFPRPDRFDPPGPEAREAEQPELFAEIRRIAAATGERVPRHVYLMLDVNAFVAQRGGIMGFGAKRVMGIGLPLVRSLTVSELRAVLAHEMGHFYGGDTRLGPWIYKTRGAIGRTIVNLARAGNAASFSNITQILFAVVLAPFRWFGTAFLRVSQAISRAQELGADRVAARCAGAGPLVDGLKKTHAATLAHRVYMTEEVLPMVADGVAPPIGEGFVRFLGASAISKLLADATEAELHEGRVDPYDSHPPLRERIRALDGAESSKEPPDTRPAIQLVRQPGRIERELIAAKLGRPIKAIEWEDVPRFWEAQWRKQAAKLAPHLREITLANLPTEPRGLYQLANAVERGAVPPDTDNATVRGWATGMFGSAIVRILLDEGFSAETPVGAPVVLRTGELAIEPFREVAELLAGKISRDAWRARWAERGLADRELGSP